MFAIPVEANQAFKATYSTNLRRALLLGLAIHLVLFVFTPPFEFQPYKLETQEHFTVVEVPDIEIPKAPPEVPEPRFFPNVFPDDDGDDDIKIPDNFLDNFDKVPISSGSSFNTGGFIAFEELPEMTEFVKPPYPYLARETGIEGTVYIRVVVSKEGKVIEASVMSSDVTPAMDKAALEAAKQCRFNPATQRGYPVKAAVVIPFGFVLD